jgi:hypothetical protein
MASILFRMVNSVFHFDAFSLREPVSTSLENALGNTRANSRPHAFNLPMHRARHRSPKSAITSVTILGNFRGR